MKKALVLSILASIVALPSLASAQNFPPQNQTEVKRVVTTTTQVEEKKPGFNAPVRHEEKFEKRQEIREDKFAKHQEVRKDKFEKHQEMRKAKFDRREDRRKNKFERRQEIKKHRVEHHRPNFH